MPSPAPMDPAMDLFGQSPMAFAYDEGRPFLDLRDPIPPNDIHGYASKVREWHEDGMDWREPARLDPETVRWSISPRKLVFVSVVLPGTFDKDAAWFAWRGRRLVPTDEREALAWGF